MPIEHNNQLSQHFGRHAEDPDCLHDITEYSECFPAAMGKACKWRNAYHAPIVKSIKAVFGNGELPIYTADDSTPAQERGRGLGVLTANAEQVDGQAAGKMLAGGSSGQYTC